MKTVVVANQKGGSGKSTLVAHLSVAAALEQKGVVAVADTDPQGTISEWFQERTSDDVKFLPINDLSELGSTVKKLDEAGAAFLFVDTAPALNDLTAEIFDVADLIVVPLCASPNDLRALAHTLPLLEKSGKPFVFVLMRVNPQAKLTTQTAIALSEHGAVVAPPIRERIVYPTSMIDGRTAIETDEKSAAAVEMKMLWQNIKKKVMKNG